MTPKTPPDHDVGTSPPFAYEPTTERYKSPYQYDGSLDEDGVSVLLPARSIVDRLGLEWDGRAAWLDGDGQRAVFDASPYFGLRPGASSVLLLSRDAARTLREDHGLVLVWSVAGEKQVLIPGGRAGPEAPRGYLRFFGTLHDTGGPIAGRPHGAFRSYL